MDDLPGRRIGSRIGKDAFRRALAYFDAPPATDLPRCALGLRVRNARLSRVYRGN